MSIFSSNNHFARNPISVNIGRSTFDRSHSHKTTFDSGKLIPVYHEEVLPGDTFNVDFSYIIRSTTPLAPVMDNSVVDIYFFFVPYRTIFKDWQKLNGENTEPWAQTEDISIPEIFSSKKNTVYEVGSLADYFGLPVNKKILNQDIGGGIVSLPFKAYCKIWNDWFRDENLQYAINIDDTVNDMDIDVNGAVAISEDSYLTNCQFGTECAPVAKLADYFTSCLPGPQKGDPVSLKIASGDISLKTLDGSSSVALNATSTSNVNKTNSYDLLSLYNSSGNPLTISGTNDSYYLYTRSGENITRIGPNIKTSTVPTANYGAHIRNEKVTGVNTTTNVQLTQDALNKVGFSSDQLDAITINDLRYAFALQKFLEKDARGGTRYIEVLRSHFGVISPDARLQRAEYLGGKRAFINIDQVLSTADTENSSIVGSTGAYSLTTGRSSGVKKSFVEHGIIIGAICVRVMQSYSQGLQKMWKRKKRLDFYWPSFANIGEQPVLKKEIYFDDTTAANSNKNDEAFGYNEAWADYRYKLNQVSGKFSPNSGNDFYGIWSYTSNYANQPTLTDEWIKEDPDLIGRTLAVQSEPQFIADFHFRNIATRPMPVYSIPGFLDRN